MKRLMLLVLLSCGFLFSAYASSEDSLKIFFVGSKSGETFKIYYQGKLLLKLKGSSSYKYLITILRDPSWTTSSFYSDFAVYRKGQLGMGYKSVGYFLDEYDPTKKYLVLTRHSALKGIASFVAIWTDEDPKKPAILHAR